VAHSVKVSGCLYCFDLDSLRFCLGREIVACFSQLGQELSLLSFCELKITPRSFQQLLELQGLDLAS